MSFISQDPVQYEDRFLLLKQFILVNLGYPTVRVELDPIALNMAIIDAITKYYSRAAHDMSIAVVSVNGDNSVTIPPDINPYRIENVLFEYDTIDGFTKSLMVSGTEDELGKYVMPQQSWNNILSNFDMVGYYLFLQRLEDFKKIVGIDRHWDITNQKVQLYPNEAKYTQVGLLYKQLGTDQLLEENDWVKNWALARAKHMLGTIRSKFSGFQVAGGNISSSGESLMSEAKEEMATLKEDLNLLQKPLPFLQI